MSKGSFSCIWRYCAVRTIGCLYSRKTPCTALTGAVLSETFEPNSPQTYLARHPPTAQFRRWLEFFGPCFPLLRFVGPQKTARRCYLLALEKTCAFSLCRNP